MNMVRWLKVYPVFEALFTVGLILVILFRRKPAARTMPKAFCRWFLPVLRRPWMAFLLIGILGFTASALLTVYTGIPQPHIHDEFSYLLGADTFAHGRLTNPPHPMWKHFETFHEIQHPTYASKYPPAQGLTLALGQVLTGYPIVGVWLSVGLACAAICWMLAGWCPLRWAWIGGLVAVIRIVFSGGPFGLKLNDLAYWSQSYWGGTVAALGGALVFGALPRIMKKPKWGDAVWLALGLAILANSRPFEGLVVSIPVAVVLGVWIIRTKNVSWQIRFYRLVLPAGLLLLLAASWMAFYNYRVTGDPFRLPYQVNESAYDIVSPFLWQPLKAEPHYNHIIMQKFYRSSISKYLYHRSFKGWVKDSIKKIIKFWLFFFGVIFIPPILLLALSRQVWRRRNVMFSLGICTLMIFASMTETWFQPHYAAPGACLCFLLVVESLRQTRRFIWRGKPVGQQFVRGVLPVLLVSAIASFAMAHHLQPPSAWYRDRERILRELEPGRERHLVIVRYGPNHSYSEWVYNRADIDDAKVVWARDMGPQGDRELIDYFKDRRVWLLRADQLPRHLVALKK
jgi:hypothetical protein